MVKKIPWEQTRSNHFIVLVAHATAKVSLEYARLAILMHMIKVKNAAVVCSTQTIKSWILECHSLKLKSLVRLYAAYNMPFYSGYKKWWPRSRSWIHLKFYKRPSFEKQFMQRNSCTMSKRLTLCWSPRCSCRNRPVDNIIFMIDVIHIGYKTLFLIIQ